MTIHNENQLQISRQKLAELEEQYETLSASDCPTADKHARRLTLKSLKAVMKQLHEEIACYAAQQTGTLN